MNKTVVLVLRILLGVFMLTFGLNKFLNFMPFPEIPGDGGTLMGIYVTSGFMKLIGVLEILGGLALLINKMVPLALTILIAILFNATIFHALHDAGNIMGALIGLILGIVLVWAHKNRFKDLLSV